MEKKVLKVGWGIKGLVEGGLRKKKYKIKRVGADWKKKCKIKRIGALRGR